MCSFRAWRGLLWALAFTSFGCDKGTGSVVEAPPADAAVAQALEAAEPSQTASTEEAQLPIGMDLEKGIPPWYVSGTGEIELERVRKGLHDQGMTLTECNKAWNPGPGSHSALILLQFTIGEEGHISEMMASENRGGDAALAECIVAGMSKIEFDPAPVGGQVTYQMPLYFAKR